MRLIDGNAVKRRAWDIAEAWKGQGTNYEALLLESVVEQIVDTQPTLAPTNEWVSVENALPPNMDDVIVVVSNNGECWTVTGYYSGTSKLWYAMLNGQDTQMDVLWWMPLPAPPARRPPEGEANGTK